MSNNENDKRRIRLDDLSNQHPLQAPEGYFDTLETRLNNRIQSPGVQSAERETRIMPYVWWAAAASILVATFVWWAVTPARPLGSEQLLAQVSAEDIRLYIQDHAPDMEDPLDEYANSLSEDDLLFIMPDLGDIPDEDLLYTYFGVTADSTLNEF